MSTIPCPPWCEAGHHGEPPRERHHWGPGGTVEADGVKVCVDLVADGDGPARVVLTDSTAEPGWNVPLGEAERLAAAIVERARRARRSGAA